MTSTLSIAVAGAAGRMGRQLIAAARAAGHDLVGGTEPAGTGEVGTDLGLLAGGAPVGVMVKDTVAEAADAANVWIDFTRPVATIQALEALPGTSVDTVIIGTTGFSASQLEVVQSHARNFAIVMAGNFSLGVNLLTALTKIAAERLGQGWDIEILESHHRRKVDAPSGTALMLGEAAAKGRGRPLEALRRTPYDGPDALRGSGEIGFAVRRGGGIVGEHDVMFASETEQIILRHNALDRRVFADGAIKAAEWAAEQKPGLYGMDDVLGV